MYRRKFFDHRYVPHERRGVLILACVLFWSILLFVTINRYVFGSMEVVGKSMFPTLNDGDRHLVNYWRYHLYPPGRGDIVVIQDPVSGTKSVKRIVGLPGETLRFTQDGITVDGALLTEPYLPAGMSPVSIPMAMQSARIPSNHYFVAGDNRPVSEDSRYYGPIPRRAILGMVETFGFGD
jgi:signal peptidase I